MFATLTRADLAERHFTKTSRFQTCGVVEAPDPRPHELVVMPVFQECINLQEVPSPNHEPLSAEPAN